MHRREFLKIVGFTSFAGSVAGFSPFLTGCQTGLKSSASKYLSPQFIDDVVLADGLIYTKMLSLGDPINSKEFYGDTNDFLAIIPFKDSKEDFFFWVNHEYPIPFLMHGLTKQDKKTKKHIITEQKSVGGSLLHFKKTQSSWIFVKKSSHNKRWSAETQIPFAWNQKIMGSSFAIGTLANCAGGQTPWNTFLSCEENFEDFYGEVFYKDGKRTHVKKSEYSWSDHFDRPPEHYGWVVEINPVTKKSQKLVALGRFAHEGAMVKQVPDGRCVVYMGDDKNNEFIYKFISKTPGSLTEGTLYAANTIKGIWEPLTLENPKLTPHFLSMTDLLIQTREAAKIAGATPQNRPEDIEILNDGTVLVALTNNSSKQNAHGSIFAIEEKNKDPLSLEFKSYTWLECGSEAGISCPDNFALDKNGNLWVTSDMSGRLMGPTGIYSEFGYNGLFFIPTQGSDKGTVYQVASAPCDAEFTGPVFSDDFKKLFICVQHPGEQSNSEGLTSHWPSNITNEKPKSSLIAIEGRLLDTLLT